ncbi:hypothetical protein MMC28_004228 [Mycoblastus sanguinarius]|nr:hypothetical protein [Mycoblastus sanguinarius]
MPPRSQPRRRQPAQSNRGAVAENESAEPLAAPSSKEALAQGEREGQDASMEAGLSDAPGKQIPGVSNPDLPASRPTTTAGSPPPRHPVQRLTSVLPRNSPNTASPPGAASGADGRSSGLKFKPKSFIRRSKEEREAVEKAEADRRATRQAAENASSTNDRGGYYSRGRGRGGSATMSKWKNDRLNLNNQATGHLGGSTREEGFPNTRARGGGWGRGGGGGAGVGRSGPFDPSESNSTKPGSRVKPEPNVKPETDRDGDVVMGSSSNSKPRRTKIKKEDQAPTYVSSEGELDSDGAERVNIEEINLITPEDTEDEDPQQSSVSRGKRPEASNSLKPIRIQREDHVERAVGVNTDASSLTSAELRRKAKERNEAGGSLFIAEDDENVILSSTKTKSRRKPRDLEFVRDERRWKGVYEDEDDKNSIVKIKDEPKDDDEVMVVDEPVRGKEPEADPMAVDEEEATKIVPLSSMLDNENAPKSVATLEESLQAPEEESIPQLVVRRPRAGGYRYPKPIKASEESDKILAELEELTSLLSDDQAESSSSGPAPSAKGLDDDGDIRKKQETKDIHFEGVEQQVYLIQLPPVIPSLRDESKPEDKKKVKTETPKPAPTINPFSTHIKDEPNIKSDPDEPQAAERLENAYTVGALTPTTGQAGMLTVYAMGSMLAAWGGMSFEISQEGNGLGLAQEVLITEFASAVTKVEDESRWEEQVDIGAKGWAFGRMQPGFVCVPEWGSLLA